MKSKSKTLPRLGSKTKAKSKKKSQKKKAVFRQAEINNLSKLAKQITELRHKLACESYGLQRDWEAKLRKGTHTLGHPSLDNMFSYMVPFLTDSALFEMMRRNALPTLAKLSKHGDFALIIFTTMETPIFREDADTIIDICENGGRIRAEKVTRFILGELTGENLTFKEPLIDTQMRLLLKSLKQNGKPIKGRRMTKVIDRQEALRRAGGPFITFPFSRSVTGIIHDGNQIEVTSRKLGEANTVWVEPHAKSIIYQYFLALEAQDSFGVEGCRQQSGNDGMYISHEPETWTKWPKKGRPVDKFVLHKLISELPT